jgi:hypothetical protein
MARPGRPRRAHLNDPDTSREELIADLATLNKMRRKPSKLALNADGDEKIIRLIKRCRDELRVLRDGTPHQKVLCKEYISSLRKTEPGRSVDPYGKLEDVDFLARFIKNCEDSVPPGFKRAFELWPRGPVKVSAPDEKRARDARIAKEQAWMKRHDEARVKRFVTADEPNEGMLHDLRHRIIPTDPASWATLRELKLATAIPERTIKKMVADFSPRKSEIVTVRRRHKFTKRGACPKRYGPRLVIGILGKFVNHLSQFPIDDVERKRLRKLAMRVKRALSVDSAVRAQALNPN